jgi:hypothetical protein
MSLLGFHTTNHPRFQPSQLSYCQERGNSEMSTHVPNGRFNSSCCAASIAAQHGDTRQFVKAVKAEKSNETL